MDGPTIQSILNDYYPAYERAHPLQAHVRDAVHAMRSCRTAVLGGHTQVCPDGHHTQVWYNSCRHRACPQCAFVQTARWLDAQKERLLAGDHYHVIFTIPHDLNDLWQGNVRVMAGLLFRAVKQELLAMLADPRWLGAVPGLLLALHTWGQTLNLHPHIHALVSGGGLGPDGDWETTRNGFLLPVVLLMERFRARLLKALRRALAKGALTLPPEETAATLETRLAKLETVKWNVRIQQRYPHGQGVAHYLARYLRGGPIGNSRLQPAPPGQVRFDYYNNHQADDNGRGKPDQMTLRADEFLRRLFLHIPPPRLVTVRGYGLYAPAKRDTLDHCRALHGQRPLPPRGRRSWQDVIASRGDDRAACCPECGQRLIVGRRLEPVRHAPAQAPTYHAGAPPRPIACRPLAA